MFKALLMVDVALFTVGYVIEIPALGNEIRTVDPTVSGWVVCIACYPPFNQAMFVPTSGLPVTGGTLRTAAAEIAHPQASPTQRNALQTAN